MKAKYLLLILALPLFTQQCKKDREYQPGNTTSLKGFVIDVSNQEPIENAEVQLIKSYNRGGGSGICCYALRNKIFTDQNGWFEYSFTHHPDSLYSVATTAPGYSYNYATGPSNSFYPLCITGMDFTDKGYTSVFYDDKKCGGRSLERVEEGIMTLSKVRLAPYATLRVHVKNVAPANGTDFIKVQLENTGTLAQPFQGANIDEYILVDVWANRFSPIYWWVTINGQQTYYEDSVFVPKGGSAEYLLEY